MQEISLGRHEASHNRYIYPLICQPDMMYMIDDDISCHSNADSITSRILGKKLFAFSLVLGGEIIGFVCLDDIDWENRNLRLKLGIFSSFADKVSLELMNGYMEEIFRFCRGNLRIVRVWGITFENNGFETGILKNYFKCEGNSAEKNMIYLGKVFE